MLSYLIIRAPPREIEFPERPVSGASQGETETPESGPHRCVLAAVWAL